MGGPGSRPSSEFSLAFPTIKILIIREFYRGAEIPFDCVGSGAVLSTICPSVCLTVLRLHCLQRKLLHSAHHTALFQSQILRNYFRSTVFAKLAISQICFSVS